MLHKKLRVGVVFEGSLQIGGGFQQPLSTLLSLQQLKDFEFIPIVFSKTNQEVLKSLGIESLYCKDKIIYKRGNTIIQQRFAIFLWKIFKSKTKGRMHFLEIMLDLHNIDVCYFLSPSLKCLLLNHHNYILTIWDLSHRDFMEFPEVNFSYEFESRENLYMQGVKKAIAVMVDSKLGKENVVRRYGIDEKRVYVSSFMPSINIKEQTHQAINVCDKYNIQGSYIYYPAQFWAHKNHIYILESLDILKQEGILITAVFSGSNYGNLEYILQTAKELGIDNQVKYIGFVPNEDIKFLYEQSLALVMPTYFGPTNIPPLEAFALGVPVIYSDLEGLREQVGDAALLCNLNDANDLARKIKLLLQDSSLRESLAQKGKERLKVLQQQDIVANIAKVLQDFSIKRKCWA